MKFVLFSIVVVVVMMAVVVMVVLGYCPERVASVASVASVESVEVAEVAEVAVNSKVDTRQSWSRLLLELPALQMTCLCCPLTKSR